MIFFTPTKKRSKNSLLKCLEKYQYGDIGNARAFNQQSLVSTLDQHPLITCKFRFHSNCLEDLFLPSEDYTYEDDDRGPYDGHGFDMDFVPQDEIPKDQLVRAQPYRNRMQNMSDEEVIIPLGHLSSDMFDGLKALLQNNIEALHRKRLNEADALTVQWKFKRGLCHSYAISKSGLYFPMVDNMIVEFGFPMNLREQYQTVKQLFANGQIVYLREYGADNFKLEFQQLLYQQQYLPPGYAVLYNKCFEVKEFISDEELTEDGETVMLC